MFDGKFTVLKKSKFEAYNKFVFNTGKTLKGQKFIYVNYQAIIHRYLLNQKCISSVCKLA